MAAPTIDPESDSERSGACHRRLVRLLRAAEKAYVADSGFDLHQFDDNRPPETVEEAVSILRAEKTWLENWLHERSRLLDEHIKKIQGY